MRNDVPIEEVVIGGAVNPGISYSQGFAEWEACIAAGLDIEKWESGEYSVRLREKAIAWHKLHNLVEVNAQDATIPKGKRN